MYVFTYNTGSLLLKFLHYTKSDFSLNRFSHLKLVSSPTCLSVGLVFIDGSKDLNYRSALLKCVKNGDRFTMAGIQMTKKILYYDGLCLDWLVIITCILLQLIAITVC